MKDDQPQRATMLSRLEFGSGPPLDEAWLHGSSDALRRLRQHATALVGAGCRLIVVTGAPGVGKRRLGRWLLRRTQGPFAARLELAAADVTAGIESSDAPTLVCGVHRLAPAAIAVLKARVAQGAAPVVLTTTEPLPELRNRSLQHEQLFGRMTDAVLDVQALHTRVDDIPDLARVALEDTVSRHGLQVRGLSPTALAALQRHGLPGNARQVRALVEHAALACTGDWIGTADLFGRAETVHDSAELHVRLPGVSLREIEIKALSLALRLADGRIVRAAELLGITRHALRRKLEKYGIDPQAAAAPAHPDAFI